MKTLVLSQSFEPVKIVSWQRAVTLLFMGKVEVLESYEENIKHPTYILKMPAVVRLLRAFRRDKKVVKFSRINVYGRDKYKCQYCGRKLRISEGTYDHVLPRAQGGKTCWENIVTCCEACNSKKANRTPEQASMRLLTKPVRPAWVPIMTMNFGKNPPDAWASYLYWAGEIEEEK